MKRLISLLLLVLAMVSACALPAQDQDTPHQGRQQNWQNQGSETSQPGNAEPTETNKPIPEPLTDDPTPPQQDEEQPAPTPTMTPVARVSLSPESLRLKVGQKKSLTATISPSTASDKRTSWSSSKPEVAIVDSSGLVTAQGQGTAEITVITKDGGRTAQATITVQEPQQSGAVEVLLMLNLVNGEREKAELAPLKLNQKLTEVAHIKSQDMIDNNYFAHESPTYGSPFEMIEHFGISFRYAAENIAMHPSVQSAHQGLMNSPGHRANILNPNLTGIGLGIVNSRGIYYVTQMYIG